MTFNRKSLMVSVAVVLIFTLTGIHAIEAASFNTTIDVGAVPYAVAYDSGKNQMFVANYYPLNAVTVISASDNIVIANISLGGIHDTIGPHSIAYDSEKNSVYVGNGLANTVSVISDETNKVIETIPVGTQVNTFIGKSPAADIVYDESKGLLFITNSGEDTVSIISDNSNTIIKNVTVGAAPTALAYNPAKGEIYVTNAIDNSVSVISDGTLEVIRNVSVGKTPLGIAYDSSTGNLYVANSADNTVSVVSSETYEIILNITVGLGPNAIAYDSGTNQIYVTNAGDNTISVISGTDNSVMQTITVGREPVAIAYNSAKGELFVANAGDGTISVISDTNAAPSPSPSVPELHYLAVILALAVLTILVLGVFSKRNNYPKLSSQKNKK